MIASTSECPPWCLPLPPILLVFCSKLATVYVSVLLLHALQQCSCIISNQVCAVCINRDKSQLLQPDVKDNADQIQWFEL